ncbi:MAG: hypothetical protein OXU26_15805 [Acidobacteriota bacterium]|nr:hypothetical protein [Acidobacteriota bacterium]MDE2965374.1 hypothetical protein [Acidobacteriota bacterium]
MAALVASVAQRVDPDCHTNNCKKGTCSVLLNGVPAQPLIVDLDCDALRLPSNRKRCDFLFVGETDSTAWVAPIELKGGGFKVDDVAKQLQEGSRIANEWLPQESSFRLVPVLAHGKGARKKDFVDLRRKKITLRGKNGKIELLRCGAELMSVLK